MEIKKGISQMAEYPNAEINYVMPKDGRMYYVLKDGVLSNGCIIATLDPKYALDEKNICSSVGVFSESGEVLIDFDKKSIKSISDELLLVVNSKLNTPEVIGVVGKENDSIISNSISEAKDSIINNMMGEMGIYGEIIFSDPYSEANVYRIDGYNNKLGKDCSFIGKNESSLYFHTNEAKSDTEIVEVNDFKQETNVVEDNDETDNNLELDIDKNVLNGFNIPNEDLQKVNNNEEENNTDAPSEEVPEETPEEIDNFDIQKDEENEEEIESKELNLNIEQDENEEENPSNDIETEENIENEESTNKSDDNEVLDNAIDVIDKMIKETNRLKEKITNLEKELEEKDKIIEESESKKYELNEILDKANEILEEIK